MRSSTPPRLHALDGVRAVAASLVVLHHVGVANGANWLAERGYKLTAALLFGGTAGGVELFFVLSGLVLALPYLRAQRPMNTTSYYSRRVKRLFPPFFIAWLLSGLSIFLAAHFPTWWTMTENLPPFQLQDWLQQLGIIYWGVRPYNFAWWSLSTEVAFYLVFPLALPLFRHVSKSRILVIPVFIVSILTSVFAFAHPLFSLPVFNRLLVFSSCFCGGMLLASVDFTPSARRGLALAGTAWVVCSAYVDVLNPYAGWGLLAFCLVSGASQHNTLIEKVLSRPLFIWVGERSYSLFLTHFAVIVLVYHGVSTLTASKGTVYFLTTRILAIPLMLLTAMLLFHFVERRFAKNLKTANAFWPIGLSDRLNPHLRNNSAQLTSDRHVNVSVDQPASRQ
jgi:peptidoglycan/LPS O-acetylase OafA/YrhL